MIRLLGCLLVLISGVLLGYRRAEEYKARFHVIAALADTLCSLKTDVCVYLLPFTEALDRAARGSAETAFFYRNVIEGLNRGEPLSDVWESSAEQISLLSTEDRSTLAALSRQLGQSDAASQADAFERCIDTLRRSAADHRTASGTGVRLSLGMGLACGLLLAIVLY